MSDPTFDEVLDDIASAQATIDQAQAHLDYARAQFPTDSEWQLEMDRAQTKLDAQKRLIKDARIVVDMVNN